ncbi:MAG: hypothetical protein QF685_06090 [Verrucomicrobiota bacterium]|nr:hypothetical protein [Verrucomicrobiota bacterium]
MSESGLNVLLMKKMKQLSTFLIVLAILCAGCGLPDRNLKENVKEQDVVCEWSLRPESLALLARDGFKTNSTHHYRIHFQTNGACLFQTVVDDFRSGVYHDVKGTWKLEHDTTGNSNIKKKNTIQIELPLPSGRYIFHLNFDKHDGKLVLWNFYGDPDSWEFMEYRKAKQSPTSDGQKAAPEE